MPNQARNPFCLTLRRKASRDLASLSLGNGTPLGIGLPKNSHSGSQPCDNSISSNRSLGTTLQMYSACLSISTGPTGTPGPRIFVHHSSKWLPRVKLQRRPGRGASRQRVKRVWFFNMTPKLSNHRCGLRRTSTTLALGYSSRSSSTNAIGGISATPT